MTQSFFYAAIGRRLTTFRIDFDRARLTRGGSVDLPAQVQYAWPHPGAALLYVVSSNGGPGVDGRDGDLHHASVLAVDPSNGELTPRGSPRILRSRPIHCSVDPTGRYLLIAYNRPSGCSVHGLESDGSIGAALPQDADIDFGIYAHQIRTTQAGDRAILVTRGNDATDTDPEDPGALKVYRFAEGRLVQGVSLAPGGGAGYGFGPRHLDFDPTGRWVFVSVERSDELQVYENTTESVVGPLYGLTSLAGDDHGGQLAGTVRCHPGGRFVYQANRTDGLVRDDGWRVATGVEDSLVVYEFDTHTGEPRVIQRVEVPTIHVRTFSIDPEARLLIAASIQPIPRRDANGGVELVPAAIVVYRIAADGKLTLARTYEINTRDARMFWTGVVSFSD